MPGAAGGPPDLFRRTVDHLLVPYAREAAGEGYHFSVEQFAKRFKLDDTQRQYIERKLAPNLKDEQDGTWWGGRSRRRIRIWKRRRRARLFAVYLNRGTRFLITNMERAMQLSQADLLRQTIKELEQDPEVGPDALILTHYRARLSNLEKDEKGPRGKNERARRDRWVMGMRNLPNQAK